MLPYRHPSTKILSLNLLLELFSNKYFCSKYFYIMQRALIFFSSSVQYKDITVAVFATFMFIDVKVISYPMKRT